jgi:hypothetical protein
MCQNNYVQPDAIKEENTVKIALWNGKVFHAGIVDVEDGGSKVHIVRLHNGRIVRREVLKIDYGFGNIRVISRPDCRYLLKGINGDDVLPGKRTTFQHMNKTAETKGIIQTKAPSREFLNFKVTQERFFKERKIEGQRMNQRIDITERRWNK